MGIMTSGAGHFAATHLEASRLLKSVALMRDLELIRRTAARVVVQIDDGTAQGFARAIGEDRAIRAINSISGELCATGKVTLVTQIALQLL